MIRFYLNNTEIDEPINWHGSSLSKGRNASYFGFWEGAVLNEGDNKLTLTFLKTEKGGMILSKAFNDFALLANVYLKVIDDECDSCNELDYKADFITYTDFECDKISVLFKVYDGIELLARANLKYAIEPLEECTLPTIPTISKTSHEISKTTTISKTQTSVLLNHSVPFSYKSGGIGLGTTITAPFISQPLIKSNYAADKVIDIVGVLKWSASANIATNYDLILEIRDNLGNVVNSYVQGTYTTGNATNQKTIYQPNYNLKPNCSIYLFVKSNTTVSSFSFTYIKDSVIDFKEYTALSLLNDTKHWGLTIKQAFEAVVELAGNGKYTVCSDYLDKFGDSFWITNELNLLGGKSPLSISLNDLYAGLNPIENLEMGMNNGCLVIKKKGFYTNTTPIHLNNAEEINLEVNDEWVYSQVSVGYGEWQANTVYQYDEICSQRNYVTEITSKNSKIDLISPFIASQYVIERLKSEKETSYGDRRDAGKIFIIASEMVNGKLRAETSENYGDLGNMLYPKKRINLRISPQNMLQNWLNILKHSGKLSFTSGEGNYTARHRRLSEGLVVENQDNEMENVVAMVGVMKAMFFIPGEIKKFCQIGQVISFDYCGKKLKAYIDKKEFLPKETGNQIDITAYLDA